MEVTSQESPGRARRSLSQPRLRSLIKPTTCGPHMLHEEELDRDGPGVYAAKMSKHDIEVYYDCSRGDLGPSYRTSL